MPKIIRGKVIQVNNDYEIVINKGSLHGITKDNRFLVYHLGKELFDPDTKESLGVLEIVCGEAKPEHIQEKITTLRTAKTIKRNRTIKKSPYGVLFGETEEIREPEVHEQPFDNVAVNCEVKQIK